MSRSVTSVTHRRQNIILRDYKLGDSVLSVIPTTGYLGVELSEDLSWGAHVNKVVSKGH